MIQNALKLAMRNKIALQAAASAGCFHCLNIFETKTITEYTDQGETGLCPMCQNDTVIAETIQQPINIEYLKSIRKFLFED